MSEIIIPNLLNYSLDSEDDILRARQPARDGAEVIDLGTADTTRIVTAVSELARNVFLYAGEGTMAWERIPEENRNDLTFVFEDGGLEIANHDTALRGEHSTSNGMGRTLSGSQTLIRRNGDRPGIRDLDTDQELAMMGVAQCSEAVQ